MSIAADIRQAWGIAAAKPVGAGLRVITFSGGGDRVRATVTDDGWKGILIEAPPGERLGPTVAAVVRASTALCAEIYAFTEDDRSARGLHLWCTRDDLIEAFVGFCEPFVVRIREGEGLGEAFAACFEEFRSLIAGANEGAVTAKLVGVLGELLVLTDLVALDASATESWCYPVLERHDFRNGTAALEVKTTLRSQMGKPVVTISALDQLEAPRGGALYLHWLRLERVSQGPICIEALLKSIGHYIDAGQLARLRTRVLGDGAMRPHHFYTFACQERRTFRVVEAFPKLAPSRLLTGSPDGGVGNVTYQLDLSAAADFECASDEAYRVLLSGGTTP